MPVVLLWQIPMLEVIPPNVTSADVKFQGITSSMGVGLSNTTGINRDQCSVVSDRHVPPSSTLATAKSPVAGILVQSRRLVRLQMSRSPGRHRPRRAPPPYPRSRHSLQQPNPPARTWLQPAREADHRTSLLWDSPRPLYDDMAGDNRIAFAGPAFAEATPIFCLQNLARVARDRRSAWAGPADPEFPSPPDDFATFSRNAVARSSSGTAAGIPPHLGANASSAWPSS